MKSVPTSLTTMIDNYTTTYEMPYSGYTIKITPLPPHYMDVIEDMYPLLDNPKRMLKLVSGDIVPWTYELPQEPPNAEEDPEGHDLYYRRHYVDNYNADIHKKRNKARTDLLYITCVDIVQGKYTVESDDWVKELEAPFVEDNRTLDLSHPGYRKLVFIKTQVIRHPTEKSTILSKAMYEEVGMQGIESALHGFRPEVGRTTDTRPTGRNGEKQGRTQSKIVGS